MTDGMFCGDVAGRFIEVYDPPWYRVDRWVRWMLVPCDERTDAMVFATGHEGLRLQRVRARLNPRVKLTHVPR